MKHEVMKMNDVVMGSGVALGLLVFGLLMMAGMLLWEIDRSFNGGEDVNLNLGHEND